MYKNLIRRMKAHGETHSDSRELLEEIAVALGPLVWLEGINPELSSRVHASTVSRKGDER